jgi:hypothetical protein
MRVTEQCVDGTQVDAREAHSTMEKTRLFDRDRFLRLASPQLALRHHVQRGVEHRQTPYLSFTYSRKHFCGFWCIQGFWNRRGPSSVDGRTMQHVAFD